MGYTFEICASADSDFLALSSSGLIKTHQKQIPYQESNHRFSKNFVLPFRFRRAETTILVVIFFRRLLVGVRNGLKNIGFRLCPKLFTVVDSRQAPEMLLSPVT
jgi:hypothetical protein